MPAPWKPLPASLPPLHLYRHLLREVSYLPPAFRPTLAAMARDRYRRHRDDAPRTAAHLSRGRNALRSLRAANSGDQAIMAKLVAKGFGRSGPRRRELLSRFVKPQGPSDTKQLGKLLGEERATATATEADSKPATSPPLADDSPTGGRGKSKTKVKNGFYDKWDQEKLLQLLRSQQRQQAESRGATSWRVSPVKNANPDQFVPERNIWGHAPAENVVRAKRARWWRLSAEKLMPPLGSGEWQLLARLSKGAQEEPEWAVPERRTPGVSLDGADDGSAGWDWKAYASRPATIVERPRSLPHYRRTGQKDRGPYGGRECKPRLSARWFRRVYNRTWQVTPKMDQDAASLRYSFAWGGSGQWAVPPATEAQRDIFEGVDSKGRVTGGGSKG